MKHGDPDLVKTAIKNGGFCDTNGIWNSIVKLPNDDHLYRERVEMLIIRNHKEVFVKKRPNGKYVLPGGSTEKDKSFEEQAIAECREEAHMNVINVKDMGIKYTEIEEPHDWVRKLPIQWDGKITHILCGEYSGPFKGKVKPEDEDSFVRSGRWYPIKECYKFFSEDHKKALKSYLTSEDVTEEDAEPIEEGYYSNYFKNKHFLKEVSNSPEVERAALVKIISSLKKLWDKSKNTSKVKRIQNDKEKRETMFFPVNTLDFTDGCTATVVLSYDNTSGTPAAALHTEEFGNLVIVYPSFFKQSLDSQIFTLLHEIGHIRLDHVQGFNQHKTFPIIGKNDNDEHRIKVAEKGKVIYPEEYADLYAILNGAKLYSILDIHMKKDEDKLYDYRISNGELAARYNKVLKDYNKLLPMVEGTLDDILEESGSSILYHGSNTDIKGGYINPKNNSHEKADYVFASPSREFALCYSGKPWHDGIMNQSHYNGKIYLTEMKAGVFKKIFDTKGYLYEVEDSSSFHTRGSLERLSTKPAKIINCTEIPNILNELKRSDVIMFEYPKKPPFWEKLNKIIKTVKPDKKKVDFDTYGESVIIESFGNDILFTEEKYADCPIDQFGIPETRSYPLNTKQRVYSACKLFGHAPNQYRKSLAENIFKAMKRYNIPSDYIGEKSQLYKYIDLY